MEQSGLDSAIISGVNNETLEALKASAQSNPTLMREIVAFLNNASPDPKPITQEEHPVFYDASKNPASYHYVPKSGMGIQKDGHKLHMFNYEVGFQNRSKELFGNQIEETIDKIKEAKASETNSGTDFEDTAEYEHICALQDIIVAAYGDIVINGNDDMTSYLYLCQKSLWALSKSVAEDIKHLAKQGQVALGLVTEQVANSVNSEELFKAAVLPREEDELEGIEALNENAINKVYAFLTPSCQTKGILLNNNVDITQPWAGKLIESCPTLDQLCALDLESLYNKVEDDKDGDENFQLEKGNRTVLEQMYAGMLGSPINVDVPPVRKYMLENGQSLQMSELLEKEGHNDLSAMSDKEIYNFASNLKDNIENLDGVKDSFADTFSFASDLMSARQSAMNDKINATGHKSELKKPGQSTVQKRHMGRRPNASMGSRVKGAKLGAAKAKLGGAKALAGAGRATAMRGALASGVGTAGASASAGGLLSAAGAASAMVAPVGLALALAPVLKGISEENEQKLMEIMSETSADRGRLESEVANLLEQVKVVSTKEDQEERSKLAKEVVESMMNSRTLQSSKMRGMGLQKDLEALATNFGSTDMAALRPHSNDADLVAAVDSGRALTALALFVDDEEDIMTPQRSLLQTPRYVNMMGPSCPFKTRTHRTTSESESLSFVTKTSHSGFSTAEKTSHTVSDSKSGKAGGWFNKVKVTDTNAITDEAENTNSYANDKQHNEESQVSVSQAIVTEFTYMPMKAFSLKEGGLMLSDYSYYRLQKILFKKVKDEDGNWKEEAGDDDTKKYKAMRFLRDFGSHIPFGVQTLGGVFCRTMKITTQSATKLSTLYSAATTEISNTNTRASKTTTDVGGSVGAFGVGASGASSSGFSTASSSGSTEINIEGEGQGNESKSKSANFQSTVTCFGPNAATQDMMYKQLMSNNATWTIIDRGEPSSYFAVWDLIDYMGQGGLLQEQVELLREVWEESALTRTGVYSGSNELLAVVMDDYGKKKAMYDFVDNLVDCIVPTSPGIFTREVADQFEAVVRKAAVLQTENELQDDPEQFIDAGFEDLNDERLFQVVKDIPSYRAAEAILLNARNTDWANHFSYYSGTFNSKIMEKAKPYFLQEMYLAIVDGKRVYKKSDWKPLFEALLSPPGIEDNNIFNADLKRSLLYRNQETGKCLLHYVFDSKDMNLIRKVYHACPEAISLKDKDGINPIQYANEEELFTNDDLLKSLFSSQEWRIMSRDHRTNSWSVNSFQFFDSEDAEIVVDPESVSSSGIDIAPPVSGYQVWLDGKSWDGSSWKDKSQNGNHPTSYGTIDTEVDESTNMKYLYGDTSSGVTITDGWPSGNEYTLFHVTKYNGANKSRIWQGTTGNWVSGHWAGNRGAFYHEGWITEKGKSEGNNVDDWGVFTDRENSSVSNVRVDGKDVTKDPSKKYIIGSIGINPENNYTNEHSNWAAGLVLIYNRYLSDDEVTSIETWIQSEYLSTGNPPNTSLDTVGGGTFIGTRFSKDQYVGSFRVETSGVIRNHPHTLELQYKYDDEWYTACKATDFRKQATGPNVSVLSKLKVQTRVENNETIEADHHYIVKEVPQSNGWRLKSKNHPVENWALLGLKFFDLNGQEVQVEYANLISSGEVHLPPFRSHPKHFAFQRLTLETVYLIQQFAFWLGVKTNDNKKEMFIGSKFSGKVTLGGFEMALLSSQYNPHTVELQYEDEDGKWTTAYTADISKQTTFKCLKVELEFANGEFKEKRTSYNDVPES